MHLVDELRQRTEPIRVGIVGAGTMGRGLVHQCSVTPGFRCVALCDLRVERALACVRQSGGHARVVDSVAAAEDAIARGEVAVCTDGDLVAALPSQDAFMEASSSIVPAARFCLTALEHRHHLVMVNAEADLAFGPHFRALARQQGVVYTSCDGDQPGVIKRLVDDLRLWGFTLVMAGNIKGFLDRRATPVSIRPEAEKRNLDCRMCAAFTDGTKLNIEMALVANALGCRPVRTGMEGPRATHVRDVLELFDLAALRAGGTPVVDYILGAQPDGGVYAVGHCDHPYQQGMLKYYKMGAGPFYLFYRPYHLCHVEAMACVAAAVLHGEALLEPRDGLRTNVIAYAKKDLRRGEVLDGIGGHACYGLIEGEGHETGLPVCLAEDLALRREVAADHRLSWADVVPVPDRLDARLHDLSLHRAARADATQAGP